MKKKLIRGIRGALNQGGANKAFDFTILLASLPVVTR